MTEWTEYPASYRANETAAILRAAASGESVALVGLSGAGKSNLLGFVVRQASPSVRLVLVDGNRLAGHTPAALLSLMRQELEAAWPLEGAVGGPAGGALDGLEAAVGARLGGDVARLCFLLDLSQLIARDGRLMDQPAGAWFNNLRALRDRFKYRLAYVAATRHPLPPDNELAELFFGRTLWLGPLPAEDAAWSIGSFARRTGQAWVAGTVNAIAEVSGRYPALLRAVCEAHAAGATLDEGELAAHPAVARRLAEFWADSPNDAELSAAGLSGIRLLMRARPLRVDSGQLTAKENLLLEYLRAHPEAVCAKDDLIRAVWPEDQVFERGVRDDSLAQLVRRLREKVEPDPARPRHIHTAPGRGYRFTERAG
jgi:hypothetical protein